MPPPIPGLAELSNALLAAIVLSAMVTTQSCVKMPPPAWQVACLIANDCAVADCKAAAAAGYAASSPRIFPVCIIIRDDAVQDRDMAILPHVVFVAEKDGAAGSRI